jgi:AcrR family transcriptional regulator
LVFEEDGFLAARISDIAERAGLSHGSFYHYFDTKEEIFHEVVNALYDRLRAPLHTVIFVHSSHASPAERIREGNRIFLESYRSEARLIRVIEQVSRYDESFDRQRYEEQRPYDRQLIDSLRTLQSRGQADPAVDVEVAAPALVAMMNRFAEMWLVQGYVDFELEHGVAELTRIWVNALGLKEEPTSVPRSSRRAR